MVNGRQGSGGPASRGLPEPRRAARGAARRTARTAAARAAAARAGRGRRGGRGRAGGSGTGARTGDTARARAPSRAGLGDVARWAASDGEAAQRDGSAPHGPTIGKPVRPVNGGGNARGRRALSVVAHPAVDLDPDRVNPRRRSRTSAPAPPRSAPPGVSPPGVASAVSRTSFSAARISSWRMGSLSCAPSAVCAWKPRPPSFSGVMNTASAFSSRSVRPEKPLEGHGNVAAFADGVAKDGGGGEPAFADQTPARPRRFSSSEWNASLHRRRRTCSAFRPGPTRAGRVSHHPDEVMGGVVVAVSREDDILRKVASQADAQLAWLKERSSSGSPFDVLLQPWDGRVVQRPLEERPYPWCRKLPPHHRGPARPWRARRSSLAMVSVSAARMASTSPRGPLEAQPNHPSPPARRGASPQGRQVVLEGAVGRRSCRSARRCAAQGSGGARWWTSTAPIPHPVIDEVVNLGAHMWRSAGTAAGWFQWRWRASRRGGVRSRPRSVRRPIRARDPRQAGAGRSSVSAAPGLPQR